MKKKPTAKADTVKLSLDLELIADLEADDADTIKGGLSGASIVRSGQGSVPPGSVSGSGPISNIAGARALEAGGC